MVYKVQVILFLIVCLQVAGHRLLAQTWLKKVGHFEINSLDPVNIVDFDPSKKTYLGYVPKGNGFMVMLIDEHGKTLRKRDLYGQGPGQFSSAMNFLGFSDTGGIWVITPTLLIKFDTNLNYKESLRFTLDDPFFTSGLTETPVLFYQDGDKNHLMFAAYPSGTSRFMRAQSLERHYLVEMFDTQNRKSFYLAPIKERSIYSKLDVSVNAMFKPIFTREKSSDLIFVTATLDNEISAIDLQTRKTISTIKIKHGRFASFDKLPISEKTLPVYPPFTLASVNWKLLCLDGGFIVLDYLREIAYEAFENKRAEDPKYHHFQDPNYHRLIFFDRTKQLSGDIPLPKNGKLMIALPGNRLLFKIENPEVEEDFVRYEIYEVVKN